MNQDTPILEFNAEYTYGELEVPLIWVTVPLWDSANDKSAGRTYMACYAPDDVSYGADSEKDEGGIQALQFGSDYYNEAFSYQDSKERENRIDCFRAAEIFYLHSMQLGNVQAMVNLGYIYAYDRCEGYNWECFFLNDFNDRCDGGCKGKTPAHQCEVFPREKRAFEYFERAAMLNNIEAMYKLGDCYEKGFGCDRDQNKAYTLYLQAYQLSGDEVSCIWGSCAYRLATCYEFALGTSPNYGKALEFYHIAETGLSEAVRSGDTYYEKNLSESRKGIKRLRQELDGIID